MSLTSFFAFRYLFSKKSQHAINYIAGISMLGFAVGTMALVVILSVMNGMETLTFNMVNKFDPDIKISPVKGKVFPLDSSKMLGIRRLPGVNQVVQVLEENAVVKYNNQQNLVRIKGVSPNFTHLPHLDSFVYRGKFMLQKGEMDYALVGGGIAYALSIDPDNPVHSLGVYVPRRNSTSMGENALSQLNIYPSGLFSIEEKIDQEYVIVPIRFARELLDYPSELSAMEITLEPGTSAEKIKKQVKAIMGEDFQVLDRREQEPLLARIFQSEKWATYAILTFIMLIAAFNMIGSLTMLVMEKRKDISVLRSLGMPDSRISGIFLKEGLLISGLGAISGLVLGLAICWIQLYTGWVAYGSGPDFTLPYPVEVRWLDILLIVFTAFALGTITSWYPAMRATRQELPRLG